MEDHLKKQLSIIAEDYAKTWDVLLRYDEGKLENSDVVTTTDAIIPLSYHEAIIAIDYLKTKLAAEKATTILFGQEKKGGLEGILGNVIQTFSGKPVYPSHESRAAHLLYFIIKDRPFSDGNKRIGCYLFLLYLRKTGLDIRIINNNGLIALALLIAESHPSHKEVMIQVIIRLLIS